MKMKAARLHAIGDFRCDTVDIPTPQGEEILLKVGACGVCGSDIPRVYAHGTSSGKYPLTLGHEFAGTVAAVGDKADAALVGTRAAIFPLIPCRTCDACAVGDYVLCDHYDYLGSRSDGGFAEYCLLPSAWHLIPAQKASMETLAMTEPACVAQHALRRAKVTAGDFVIIFGAGPIGIMAARWARIFGAEVMLADVDPYRVELARKLGFAACNARENVAEAVKAANHGRLAAVAIEGTGAGAALIGCVDAIRSHGRIALLGNPGGDSHLPLAVHSKMLRKEVEIYGVWNSNRAPWPMDEWTFTVAMMDAGKLEVADLITHTLPLEEMPQALQGLQDKQLHALKVMCRCDM